MLNIATKNAVFCLVAVWLVFFTGCDSVPHAERSIFGPNGEQWCFEFDAWKYINSDRNNCGDCNSPCKYEEVCFSGECISREEEKPSQLSDPDGSTGGQEDGSDQSVCAFYATCLDGSCFAGCQVDNDCTLIEEYCALYEEGISLAELQLSHGAILRCEATTGDCVPEFSEPPAPPEGSGGNQGSSSGYTTPPITNSDASCGPNQIDCTASNRVCDSGQCVCDGCEFGGVCYAANQNHFLWSWPNTECGATCYCSESGWDNCSARPTCPR